jgi:hypothetical protein
VRLSCAATPPASAGTVPDSVAALRVRYAAAALGALLRCGDQRALKGDLGLDQIAMASSSGRAFSRPWSHSTRLLAYRPARCQAAGGGSSSTAGYTGALSVVTSAGVTLVAPMAR